MNNPWVKQRAKVLCGVLLFDKLDAIATLIAPVRILAFDEVTLFDKGLVILTVEGDVPRAEYVQPLIEQENGTAKLVGWEIANG